ncbi:hypothetical protein TIFTF001_027115 [Ficus carica]|uniref:Uncharacterized protein n=1 Tax=Ficus carica TaxID=3494 RepID=A0AA88IZ48_FICCA|nr:hypothetical protein TIFTF001_027115 [Ficus carica]
MSQDHEEECSTQTQVGKSRRTNSPRFNPDEDGQPLRKEGDELQSWIGVLAREHIPIWIFDFRSADLAPRKEIVWMEVFEKTGKYADQHERWLDMRVKPDGQFKKEEFKTIAETIEEFSQQETQGSFESVGTEDILTKALGNAEHSGRIRVSNMKRQLNALERTVQELCAKHGINRETMAEETTAPTVDQHNRFKASCTINEK